jgi:hypothetical protein
MLYHTASSYSSPAPTPPWSTSWCQMLDTRSSKNNQNSKRKNSK